VVLADATDFKINWHTGGSAATDIFAYYQPQLTRIYKLDDKNNSVIGAQLQLYYYNNDNIYSLLESWTTDGNPKNLFLMPGRYILMETNYLDGYEMADDIEFFIDDDGIKINGEVVENIVMIDELVKKKLTVHHYIEGTNIQVPLNDGTPAQDIVEKKFIGDNYTTNPILDEDLSDKFELYSTPSNSTGVIGQEDVVVTYYYKRIEEIFTINKYQEDGVTPLQDAKFDIKSSEEIKFGDLVANGDEGTVNNINIVKQPDTTPYYYYYDEDTGCYIPTNGLTYVRKYGGYYYTNEVAKSVYKIDLTKYTSSATLYLSYYGGSSSSFTSPIFKLTVTSDEGYNIFSFKNTNANTFQYSNFNDSQNIYLEGGKIYTINVESSDRGVGEEFIIQRMNCTLNEPYTQKYGFELSSSTGYLESSNQGIAGSLATSYVPIDLRSVIGNVTLETMAFISGSSTDIGYVTVSPNTNIPDISDENGRIIYVPGDNTYNNNYTGGYIELVGGGMYYLHFGYKKSEDSTNAGTDTFTIESVQLYYEGEHYNVPLTFNDTITIQKDKGEYITNSQGKIEVQLPAGTYEITETEAPAGYVLPDNPTQTVTINKTSENVLNITNEKQKGHIIVHHYIEGTTDKVPSKTDGQVVDDENKEGNIGASYETQPSENVSDRYEVVTQEVPNASGTYQEETIEVIYYYKLKDPIIENSEITKTSTTAKITELNQKIPYTITYRADVNYFTGTATVVIEDQLPYDIDETNSVIAGGTYNSTAKTITWTEEISDIDTETNGKKQIEITKEIELTYKDVEITEINIENQVQGTITLSDTAITDTVTDDETIPVEFKVKVTINKEWEDNEIQAQRRPSTITFKLKADGSLIGETKTLNVEQGETSVTFINLPKYNNEREEIQYEVEEVNSGEFYQSSIGEIIGTNEKEVTVTNTFTKPNDKVSIRVNKEWNDNNDEAGKRPNSIKVQVKNGTTVEKEVTVTEVAGGTEWYKEITGLDKYNDNGQEIEYIVDEEEVQSGDLEFYSKEIGEITGTDAKEVTITNTFTVPEDMVKLTVNKVWEEENSTQAQRRPEQITLLVKDGDSVVQEYAIDTAEETSHTFTNLAKYDSLGQEIEYTVDEAEVQEGDLKFYSKAIGEVTGTGEKTATITNTFTVPGDTLKIVINKAWEDEENVYNTRPENISFIIYKAIGEGNPEAIQSLTGITVKNKDATNITATAQNGVVTIPYGKAPITYEGLAMYNSNGQEYTYTVAESEVEDYIPNISYGNSNNILTANVTNRLSNEPNKVLTISKNVIGDMADIEKDFTFTVQIGELNEAKECTKTKANGSTETVNITFTNGEGTFTLKHGESISIAGLKNGTTYTVTEKEEQGYSTTIVEENADDTDTNKTNGAGTIVGQENSVTFTNEKSGSPATGVNMNNTIYIFIASVCIALMLYNIINKTRKK